MYLDNFQTFSQSFNNSDSCSDEPGNEQADRRHHHHKHGNTGGNNCEKLENMNSSRRHKSSSPNRKPMRSRSQGECTCGGDSHQHNNESKTCCKNSAGRSKSTGHMTNEVRGGGNDDCHNCHCDWSRR